MDLSKIPLMNAIVRKMEWLSQQQGVLAENISNADTPAYKTRKIDPPEFRDLLDKAPLSTSGNRRIRMASTQPGHMSPGGSGRTYRTRIVEGESTDTGPNGNNVVLEEQMMEMGNTQMEYGMLVNLYRKHVDILRTALGRG